MRASPMFARPRRLLAAITAAVLLFGLPATRAHAHVTSPYNTPTERLVETTLRNMILLDMQWDPVHKLLYALPFAGSGDYSNSLVAIDPRTKTVVRQLAFGTTANRLDATDDFSSLVVTLGDRVVIVDVATFTITKNITIGTIAEQTAYAIDVDYMPGSTDTFAVATKATDQFTRAVVLFKGGVRQPTMPVTAGGGGLMSLPDLIRFVSPTKLVGVNYTDLFEFNVSSTGVTYVDTSPGAFPTSGPAQQDLVIDTAGALWANSGRIFDPITNATIGTLPTRGPLAVDPSRGRVYEASDDKLHAYDKTSRTEVGAFTFSVSQRKRQMTKFGDGFAIASDFDLILLTPPKCAGKDFTITGTSTTITGTDGDDVIIGTPGNDIIDGRGGNDIICGVEGNDRLVGGDGNDTLIGGVGDDYLFGGAGADDLHGNEGIDAAKVSYTSEAHSVTLDDIANDGAASEGDNYRSGIETIVGSPGPDRIIGSDLFDESLYGAGGNDTLDGRGASDLLVGGEGNDHLLGSDGADDFDGGPGVDAYVIGASELQHLVSLDDLPNDGTTFDGIHAYEHDNVRSSIEIVVGTAGPDTLSAGATGVWFAGGAGDDHLVGGPAADKLDGGTGNDSIDGRGVADIIIGGDGDDTCVPGVDIPDAMFDCETSAAAA